MIKEHFTEERSYEKTTSSGGGGHSRADYVDKGEGESPQEWKYQRSVPTPYLPYISIDISMDREEMPSPYPPLYTCGE